MSFDITKEAFKERAAACLRATHPEYSIEVDSSGNILINGRQFDVENLYRICAQENTSDFEIKVQEHCTYILDNSEVNIERLPLASVRNRILPRIRHKNIFEVLNPNSAMHVPFVNNTIIHFVGDYKKNTVSLTNKCLAGWGTTLEEIEYIARKNLEARTLSQLKLNEAKDGSCIAYFKQEDGYDAARLLLSELHKRLAPILGREFYAAIPNRDIFIAFPVKPISLVNKVLDWAKQCHEREPYPITPDFFYVTQDGVSGTINDSV